MRVLLPTDGSKEAAQAMRAASRFLRAADREVHVLYVTVQPRAPKSGAITRRAYQQRMAEETRRVLKEAKQILGEEGVDALTFCQSGSPAAVIMRESESYDITAVGAKGLNERSEFGLGPVASRLVEHGSGCVLIMDAPQTKPAFCGCRVRSTAKSSDGVGLSS